MSGFVVDSAHPRDIESWLELAEDVEPLFGPMPDIRSVIERNIARGSALVVRDEDGYAVGGLLLGGADDERRISWLAVRVAARRRGIGHALVDEAVRRVGRPCTLSVVTFGPDVAGGDLARRLYTSLGFRPGPMVAPGPDGGSRQRFERRLT